MDDTSVDCAAMARAAQQIEAKHQQIHMLQERLQGQMVKLSSRWPGDASAAFQHRYSKFDTEFERVKQGLDRVHTSLVETSREHFQREDMDCGNAAHVPPVHRARTIRAR